MKTGRVILSAGRIRGLPKISNRELSDFYYSLNKKDIKGKLDAMGIFSRRTIYDFSKLERICPEGLFMSVEACKDAIGKSGLSMGEIELFLYSTPTPERILPYDAGEIHKRIELNFACHPVNVVTGCGGGLSHLCEADRYLYHANGDNVLICANCNFHGKIPDIGKLNGEIREDAMNKLKNYWPILALFGSGAGALVLKRDKLRKDEGILKTARLFWPATPVIASEGYEWYEGSKQYDSFFTVSRDVAGIQKGSLKVTKKILQQLGVLDQLNSFDGIIFYIPNCAFDFVVNSLEIERSKLEVIREEEASLVQATVFVCIDKAWRGGRWKEGSKWLFVSLGEGIEGAGAVYRVPIGYGCDS